MASLRRCEDISSDYSLFKLMAGSERQRYREKAQFCLIKYFIWILYKDALKTHYRFKINNEKGKREVSMGAQNGL